MTQIIAMREARQNLSELVNRVAYGNERISLTRKNKPVAVLVSLDDAKILEALENKADLKDLEAMIKEELGETVSWEEARRELGL